MRQSDLFLAMRESNTEAVLRCLSPEAAKEFGAATESDMHQMTEEMKRKFKALRILAKRETAADEVLIAVQMDGDDVGDAGPGALPLKRINGEWKVNWSPAR